MKIRDRFVIVMACLCGMPPTLFAQELPRITSRDPQVEITLSGALDTKAVVRDGSFNEAVQNFSLGLVGPAGIGRKSSDHNFLGRFTLRTDIRLDDLTTVVLKFENQVMDGDLNGNGRIDSGDYFALGQSQARVSVENAYLHSREFLWPELSVQTGMIDLQYKLRPMAEPFFLHLDRSESSFTTNAAGTAIQNVLTRDELEAVGVKARWDGFFWAVDAFSVTTVEGGNSGMDEGVSGVFAEIRPMETLSLMALAVLNYGPAKGAEVWTIGGGIDYHLSSWIEVFGEGYMQFGTLTSSPETIDKKAAYGLEGGVRLTYDRLWGEVSYWFLTGDKDPNDLEDNAFQSYENVNQFLIVEDSVFGLDLDTNLRAVKGTFGFGPVPAGGGKNLILTADVGVFEFDERLYDRNGLPFFNRTGFDLGTEVDTTATLEYSAAVVIQAKIAYLMGSDVLEALTRESDDQTWITLLGVTAQF